MSVADRRETIGASAFWLHNWPRQYGFALIAVAAATLLRYGLDLAFGFSDSFVLFYPPILGVALLAGLGPGLFATSLSMALAAYFLATSDSFKVSHPRDMVGLALFGVVGVTVCWLADLTRRRAARLQEFEKAVEGLEEMITVIDRDYRYVLVNRAFLNYRGMKREELLGRRVQDVLSPGVFETTIKEKLDECFQNKIVEYEMRYTYPSRGERDLFISYFPIEGPGGVDRVACVLQDITDQKQAKRSLELFRSLMDQSNDAVEVLDPETLRFLDVNEKACKDLGYTREELLSRTVFDIDREIDESMHARMLEELRDAGFAIQQSVHTRKDGSIFPVEISLRRVELDRSYVVTVTRDISERKRTEAALQESEDRYRDLVEHSEDLVCTHDLEGRLLSANPASARMLGYEVGELIQIPMRELIAPESREQFKGYLQRIKTAGADQGLLCVVTRNGKRRIWEYNNTLRTEGVASPIVRGMARDVTERKRAEAALRASEQRYRLLFEKNVAGVAIASMDGEVLDCNDGWARILGYCTAGEIRGRRATEFYFNLEDREPLLEELRQAGGFSSREMKLRRKDGTPVWVVFNAVVVAGGQHGESLIQATAIDITERKIAEDALRKSEEGYRRFVAQSSEGIYREELDTPLSIDLPEDELVHHIMHDSYMAECNDAMARMYGFTAGRELIRKRLTEMLIADDPRNIEMTREYIRSGFKLMDHESHEVDIHGDPKVFRNSMIGIVENGKLVRTWGIQRDVTEQVRLEEARSTAEKALQVSENHFRLLVEQASDGIFIAHAQGKYLDVNSAGAEMLGYTREEILQLSISDIVMAEDTVRVVPEVAHFAAGATVRSEWMFRRKDGTLFPGEVSGKQLPDGRLQGILRDISERRQAEETMRRNEERFRVALKDSPITVFNQDRDLRYTWIYNPQTYWQHDAIGKTDTDIIGAKKSASLTELKRRVLKTGAAFRQEVVIPHNGQSYAFDITVDGHRATPGDGRPAARCAGQVGAGEIISGGGNPEGTGL
jgi:PAS domain S-box-containing protein